MKRFLVRIFIFISAIFLIDRTLFLLLKANRPPDYKKFLDAKKHFFEQDNKTQVLIVGDSHIADALDTRTIERLTGLTSFNLGIYHSTPFETYFIIKEALLKLETPPKYAIMGTNPEMLYGENNMGVYSPLVIGNTLELVLQSKDKFSAKTFLKSLREKGLFSHLYAKLLGKKYTPTREVTDVHHGFLKFTNTSTLDSIRWNQTTLFDSINVNRTQLDYFIKSVKLLQEKQITVLLVNPPLYYDTNNIKTAPFNSYLADNLKRKGIDLDLFTFPNKGHGTAYCCSKEYFLNSTHLNYTGAKGFTEEFTRTLLNKELSSYEE
ncbi:MAG: hypothetical protein ACI9L9_001569 [Marivirga sp.]|jgi:hypothetical protein